jgi:hypothetical protein
MSAMTVTPLGWADLMIKGSLSKPFDPIGLFGGEKQPLFTQTPNITNITKFRVGYSGTDGSFFGTHILRQAGDRSE